MKSKIASNMKAQAQDIFKTVTTELTESGLNKRSTKYVNNILDNQNKTFMKKANDLIKAKDFVNDGTADVLRELKKINKVVDTNEKITKPINRLTDAVFGDGTGRKIQNIAANKVFSNGVGSPNPHMNLSYMSAYTNTTVKSFGKKGKEMFSDYYLEPIARYNRATKKGMEDEASKALKTIGARYGALGGAATFGAVAANGFSNDEIQRY